MFLIAATVATIATVGAVTRANAMHALLHLIVSLLAVAVVMFTLGAPFAAALEVIVYAGAILVLMVFVVMMLNLGRDAEKRARLVIQPAAWIAPGILSGLLLGVVLTAILNSPARTAAEIVPPKAVGASLFTTYVLAVQLAGFMLLAALIGAFHLSRKARDDVEDGA